MTDLRSRGWVGLFPGTVEHYARMLDVLHITKAAILCRAGAWHGGGGLLAGGVGGEDGVE